jgi:hypothetical protein
MKASKKRSKTKVSRPITKSEIVVLARKLKIVGANLTNKEKAFLALLVNQAPAFDADNVQTEQKIQEYWDDFVAWLIDVYHHLTGRKDKFEVIIGDAVIEEKKPK